MPNQQGHQMPTLSVAPYLDYQPEIAASAWVHPSACIIGQATIGAHSSVWCNAVIRADVNHISIGHHSNIQDLSMLHVSHKTPQKPMGAPLIIGNYVTVGHSVILHGCTIQDECLIGMGSIVMDDVIIEKHVMLGAGSLVAEGKTLLSGHLYLGRPAKLIRALTAEEIAYFQYSAQHYATLAENHARG
jgi:carbonic anhydrase/acetyltransferase-like protein (isoleucine patch superfamily)